MNDPFLNIKYNFTCPRYEYLKWSCLTARECLNLNNRTQNKEWFTYNGTCMQVCPSTMERDKLEGCASCNGTCTKVCCSIKVDSIQAAQNHRGCTFINGSLEIHITSGKQDIIARELEENLGNIEEIRGYLKVHRSFPLINLKFLRNLKAIHGEFESNKPPFSFIVLENQNLQELWDFGNGREFKIHKGRVYFHFNPKLCLKHINEMARIAGLGNLTNFEAAKESNGGKFACNPINVTLNVTNRTHNSLVLKIETPHQSSHSFHR
jgi:insulin receptor